MGYGRPVSRRLIVFALAVVACGHAASRDATPTPTPAPAADDDPSCPVVVPGTSVAVEDTTDGAALVFVTTGDVAKVRVRARFLALDHSRRELDAQAGKPASEGDSLSAMISTHATAEASDIDHGARVVFKAVKPDDAGALQSELRMHVQHLAGGTCKMVM
jgi:hypothetical protein